MFLRTLTIALILFSLSTFAKPIQRQRQQQQKRSLPNNFECKPSLEHPSPLILVHGLFSDSSTWSFMKPLFEAKGYCVFNLDYGFLDFGLGDIEEYSKKLSMLVDEVLEATKATKVDIFGHSEGSIIPRVYMNKYNGVGKIGSFAAIGPVNYGTSGLYTMDILKALGLKDTTTSAMELASKASAQLIEGSDLINELNKNGDTYSEIQYLMIVTRFDEAVVPYQNGFLRNTEHGNVLNIELQDFCPTDLSGHMAMLHNSFVFGLVNSFMSTGSIEGVKCNPIDLISKIPL